MADILPLSPSPGKPATVIVFGNEKGGSGKSTAAMHVAVGLLRLGYRVGTIDLDARQGTLTRYFQNRRARMAATGHELPAPTHLTIHRSEAPVVVDAHGEEKSRLEEALGQLLPVHDFIIVDTPGSDTHLSRLGHSYADMLITPLNDSFVDLDLFATVDPETHKILRPSIYSETVWEQRKQRAIRGGTPIDWIVMRNRLGHTEARNKKDIETVVELLAKRIGFRTAPGFGERVIFRELFLKGLTLLDMREEGAGAFSFSMSHVAARQEVRALLEAINPQALRAKSGSKPAQAFVLPQ